MKIHWHGSCPQGRITPLSRACNVGFPTRQYQPPSARRQPGASGSCRHHAGRSARDQTHAALPDRDVRQSRQPFACLRLGRRRSGGTGPRAGQLARQRGPARDCLDLVGLGPRMRIACQMHGGVHERGMRSGTLCTHQIVEELPLPPVEIHCSILAPRTRSRRPCLTFARARRFEAQQPTTCNSPSNRPARLTRNESIQA